MKSKKYIKIQFDNKILFRSKLTKLIKDLDNLCKKLSLSNTEFITFKHVVCKYSKRCYLSPITKNSYIYPLIRYNY